MYESIYQNNGGQQHLKYVWTYFTSFGPCTIYVHIFWLHFSLSFYPWVTVQWVQQQMHRDIQTFREGKVHLFAIIFQSIIRYGSSNTRKFFENSIWEKLFYTFRSLFDFTEWKMIFHLLTNHSINIWKYQISFGINSVPIHITSTMRLRGCQTSMG